MRIILAGYSISPALAHAIDRLDLKTVKPVPGSKVVWLEILSIESRSLSKQSEEIVQQWCLENIETEVVSIVGKPFWNSLEIYELPALLETTTKRLAQ